MKEKKRRSSRREQISAAAFSAEIPRDVYDEREMQRILLLSEILFAKLRTTPNLQSITLPPLLIGVTEQVKCIYRDRYTYECPDCMLLGGHPSILTIQTTSCCCSSPVTDRTTLLLYSGISRNERAHPHANKCIYSGHTACTMQTPPLFSSTMFGCLSHRSCLSFSCQLRCNEISYLRKTLLHLLLRVVPDRKHKPRTCVEERRQTQEELLRM